MIIDEEKIRARSSLAGKKWLMPSARFKEGDSKQKKLVESAKLIIGISVVISMVFALAALIYTLATESMSAADTLIEKSKPIEKPHYMQVTFKPKKTQQNEAR